MHLVVKIFRDANVPVRIRGRIVQIGVKRATMERIVDIPADNGETAQP